MWQLAVKHPVKDTNRWLVTSPTLHRHPDTTYAATERSVDSTRKNLKVTVNTPSSSPPSQHASARAVCVSFPCPGVFAKEYLLSKQSRLCHSLNGSGCVMPTLTRAHQLLSRPTRPSSRCPSQWVRTGCLLFHTACHIIRAQGP
jgi:hypothetical protein